MFKGVMTQYFPLLSILQAAMNPKEHRSMLLLMRGNELSLEEMFWMLAIVPIIIELWCQIMVENRGLCKAQLRAARPTLFLGNRCAYLKCPVYTFLRGMACLLSLTSRI